MKKIRILCFVLFLTILELSYVKASPMLQVDQPIFVFNAIPEGTSVTHEFKIKNTGDSILNIEAVLPP